MSHPPGVRLVQTLGALFVCLGIATYGLVAAWLVPLSARLHYDPSLQYMLVSLSSFRGVGYAYIDHPGTPVEVFGTVILALGYPLVAGTSEGFIGYHLAHPQQFLSVAQSLLVLASLGVCVLVSRHALTVSHWSQAMLASGLAAGFFVLHPSAFESLSRWSHESFCFPAGTLLSLAVLVAARQVGGPSRRVVLGIGFATGVLTAVQLYFAAWVVGAVVALSLAARSNGATWRQTGARVALVGVMALLGFAVATLPIVDKYRHLAVWIWLLISHQGSYGGGPQGAPSPDLLAANLERMILDAPALFAALGAGALLVATRLWVTRGWLGRQPGLVAAGLGFIAQLVVLVLLVAKHPGVRYLLPIAATLPLMFAIALDGLDTRSAAARALVTALGLGLLAAYSVSLVSSVAAHQRAADRLLGDDATSEKLLTQIAAERGMASGSVRALWTYGTTSPCYALWFGNDYASRVFLTDIDRLCSRDRNLNIWNVKVTTPSGDIPFVDYQDWDVVVLNEDVAHALPQVASAGDVVESPLVSPGQTRLLFVARKAAIAAAGT